MRKHVNSEHKANRKLFFGSHNLCDFCGMVFRHEAAELARHVKDTHKLTSGNCTYGCPCCHRRFRTLVPNYRNHLILQHSVTPRPTTKQHGYPGPVSKLICDICGNSLVSRMSLCDHKLVRHGVEPEEMEEYKESYKILRCEKGDECGGFRALRLRTMKDHMMKKHGAERRWKCEICGKGFTESYKRKAHMEIHQNKDKGLRPYQCEICGNSVKN